MLSKSIRTSTALILGSVVVLVQSILIFMVASSIYNASIASNEREMDLMVKTLAKSASDFGAQQMEKMRGVAKIPAIKQYLSSKNLTDEVDNIVKAMSLASPNVNSFYIFDEKGTQLVLYIQGKTSKPNPLADREYIKDSLAGKEGYSSVPTKSLATGNLIVSVTAPITDASGKVLGGVGMSYMLDQLIADYIDATKIGKTGHPFILSPKGIVIGHPDRALVLKDISGDPGIAPMLSSASGVGTITRNGQVEKISWVHVPNWKWVLAFAMDTGEIESHAQSQRNFMILLGAIAVVALIGVSLLAMEKIAVAPLKQLEQFASAVASGDLGKKLELRLDNEIGKLADSLRTMVTSLKTKIEEADEKTRVASQESARAATATKEAEEARLEAEQAKAQGMLQAANQLEGVVEIATSASEQLSAQIEQSSRGSEEQSQRVGETATAMEEMNATVLEVAKNASHAAKTSDEARKKALEGQGVVSLVVKGIEDVQKQALELKQDMSELGKQAEGIGQILNVISDIADQTNLLALNAAIEAARAGDAGRGFAVVADEVRKLAEKTMTATKEVGEAIRGIQDGTRKNMDNVDRTTKTIENATDMAGKSGEALNEIVRLVDESTDQVRSIATASEEQSAASEEINRSIEQVATISAETSQAMNQAAHAVSELASQTLVLQGLINDMKGESASSKGLPSASGRQALRA